LEGHFKEGLKLPSWMLSDGTLRFIALTLLAYLPLTDKIYLIEEPENGIHPKALEYVYQSLSSIYDGQIFIATHSPILLQLAKPNDILCFKLTEDGTTKIIKGDEHPVLKEWRKEVNLGDLFASGIL
jgi:predicted ATPase